MRRFSLVSISVAVAVLATLTVGSTVAPGAGADATDIATDYVNDNKQQLGLTGADVNDMRVTNTVVDPGTRTTHVYFQQVHKDIGVYNGLLTVNVAADGWVVSSGNRFVPNLAAAAGGQSAKRADEAAEAAAKHVGLAPRDLRVVEDGTGPSKKSKVSSGGVAAAPIDAELVWSRRDAGGVRLAWNIKIDEAGGDHLWSINVDAENGDGARDERLRRRGHGSRHRVGDRPALRHGGIVGASRVRSRHRRGRLVLPRVRAPVREPLGRRPVAGAEPGGSERVALRLARHERRGRAGVHAHAGQQRARVRRPRQQQRPGPGHRSRRRRGARLRLPARPDDTARSTHGTPRSRTSSTGTTSSTTSSTSTGSTRRRATSRSTTTARAAWATTTFVPRPRTAVDATTRTSARTSTAAGPGCRCSSGARRCRTRSWWLRRPRSPGRTSARWPGSARASSRPVRSRARSCTSDAAATRPIRPDSRSTRTSYRRAGRSR